MYRWGRLRARWQKVRLLVFFSALFPFPCVSYLSNEGDSRMTDLFKSVILCDVWTRGLKRRCAHVHAETLGLFVGLNFAQIQHNSNLSKPFPSPIFQRISSVPPGSGEGVQWSMGGDHKLNDNSDLVSFAPPATVRRRRRVRLIPKKEKYPSLLSSLIWLNTLCAEGKCTKS